MTEIHPPQDFTLSVPLRCFLTRITPARLAQVSGQKCSYYAESLCRAISTLAHEGVHGEGLNMDEAGDLARMAELSAALITAAMDYAERAQMALERELAGPTPKGEKLT